MSDAAVRNLFTLFQAGRYAEMAVAARALLTQQPEDGALWKALSVAQQMLGEDALPALERTARLLPGDAELSANRGVLLAARGCWPAGRATPAGWTLKALGRWPTTWLPSGVSTLRWTSSRTAAA